MKVILLLGRIFFSLIFLVRALHHFSPQAIEFAARHSLPMPGLLVPLGGILCLLGGLSILLGYKTHIGCWLLVIFLFPTTFMMHRFWEVTDPQMQVLHNLCFFKNLSMLGAVLMIAYFGSGPFSLSKCKERSK